MLQATAAAAVSALLLSQRANAKTFSSDDISGVFEGDPFDVEPAGPLPPPPDGSSIGRPAATQKGNLVRMCGCTNSTVPETDDIRGISDQWAIGGNRVSSHGLTNLVWAWGTSILYFRSVCAGCGRSSALVSRLWCARFDHDTR